MQSIQTLSKNLKQISALYNKLLLKQLSSLEINNYSEILLILAAQTTPLTQNQLARMVQIDKSPMVHILHKLAQKGMVNIVRNPHDRREHYVYLTSEAEKIIPTIENVIDQTTSLVQDGITQERLNDCFDVLETMQQNLLQVLRKDAG